MSNQRNEYEIPEEEIRHPGVAYDRTDLGAGSIFIFLAALAVGTGILLIVVWGFLRYATGYSLRPQPPAAATVTVPSELPGGDPAARFPAPRLQPDPVADLNKFRAAAEERLNTYGWVDPQASVVHIPISRAMDILAQRGLPTRPPPQLPPAASFGSNSYLAGGMRSGSLPAGAQTAGPREQRQKANSQLPQARPKQ